MARLIWTSEARWWLGEIYGFISGDNPDAAQRVVQGIFSRAQLLAEFPELGYAYRPRTYPGVRVLIYGRYRIVYKVEGEGIFILGVFHGALDLKRHLQLK